MPTDPKWREAQLQAMLALGDAPQDAERVLAAMERITPDDPARLPDPESFAAMFGQVTPEDIADAQADWMVRARPEWKRLLTATAKVQEFNPWHDRLGRFATGPGMHAPDTGGGGNSENTGIKYKPSEENVSLATRKADYDIKRNAKDIGESPKEYEAVCADNLKKMMGDPPIICIRSSAETALKVIKGGRFKTQFETGTSGGVFDPEYRAMAEENGLGYPKDVIPSERPVYGYVRTARHGGSNYGAVEFELNSRVGERTTVTMDDSLEYFGEKVQVGALLSNPTKECWDSRSLALHQGETPGGYIEAQIQGGVRSSDIRRVFIKAAAYRGYPRKLLPEYAKVVAMAKKQGLEVVLDPDNR